MGSAPANHNSTASKTPRWRSQRQAVCKVQATSNPCLHSTVGRSASAAEGSDHSCTLTLVQLLYSAPPTEIFISLSGLSAHPLLPCEFGIFFNWGGLVDLESKFSAAEKKYQIKRGGGRVRVKNIEFQISPELRNSKVSGA